VPPVQQLHIILSAIARWSVQLIRAPARASSFISARPAAGLNVPHTLSQSWNGLLRRAAPEAEALRHHHHRAAAGVAVVLAAVEPAAPGNLLNINQEIRNHLLFCKSYKETQ